MDKVKLAGAAMQIPLFQSCIWELGKLTKSLPYNSPGFGSAENHTRKIQVRRMEEGER